MPPLRHPGAAAREQCAKYLKREYCGSSAGAARPKGGDVVEPQYLRVGPPHLASLFCAHAKHIGSLERANGNVEQAFTHEAFANLCDEHGLAVECCSLVCQRFSPRYDPATTVTGNSLAVNDRGAMTSVSPQATDGRRQ